MMSKEEIINELIQDISSEMSKASLDIIIQAVKIADRVGVRMAVAECLERLLVAETEVEID